MTCPKCGSGKISIRYHVDRYGHVNVCKYNSVSNMKGEHLHYECDCGYDWTAPCLDAKQEAT